MRSRYKSPYKRNKKPISRKLIAIIAVAVVVVVLVAGWFIFGYWADNLHIIWRWFVNSIWKTWLFPGGWNLIHATPFFWLLVLTAIIVVVHLQTTRNSTNKRAVSKQTRVTAIVTGVIWLVTSVATGFMWSDWNGRFYNSATTYMVTDMDSLPNSVTRVHNSSRLQVNFDEGVMPDSWEHRKASATGAAYVMQKTGDTIQNSELMKETVSYIYDDNGGSWTGIRNGTRRQPVYGIASWSGAGEAVKTCEFKGDNELSKAFDTSWGLNLSDDIAAFNPNFLFDTQDMYGYCDGDKPVIVIPGAVRVSNVVQAADQSYGVITLTGSPTGEPHMEFTDTVKPGDLPGPVYPTKLVEKQRDALAWSAGRVWPWQSPVGFTAATSVSQSDNNTDFLLKSKDDGRLYWVTPLKPSNTESETISAYALVSADEMTAGQLNPQRVYVLNDNDPNIVNFNDLENAVTQAVAVKDPGFFTGGEGNSGSIVEFIPTGTGTWRVFAERGGRAVYEIHVTGGTRLNTSVIELTEDDDSKDSTTDTDTAPPTGSSCGDPTTLSDTEIAECINGLSKELVKRTSADK